ncbi:MAG: c-type cytochrome [Acidimicrobiia bacterium]
MTEIPEHLLKRSRERRGAVGLPGGEGSSDASGSASSTSAPAVAAKAAPAAAAKAPAPAPKVAAPKPDRPEVLAAKTRKKIPFWAMPVLGLLPVWLFIYAEAMSPPTVTVTGPLAEGAALYTEKGCSGCHGATGGGGAGYQLSEGSVHKTFPKFEDQLAFVANGSPAVGTPYGDPAVGRISGARGGAVMAVWKEQLTGPELIAVVCHERFSLQGLSGDNPGDYAEEYAEWCAPEAPKFLEAEEAAAG